jgi:uncharacterized protein
MKVERENCCVLLFARCPEPGVVKTRLAGGIGNRRAAEVYCSMVRDSIEIVKQSGLALRICYWPPEKEEQIREACGYEYSYVSQRGSDLSQRLLNAFGCVFDEGFEYAIALGSDSPDLPAAVLADAGLQLTNTDAVLGPAADGGYYLIGFSRKSFSTAVFEGIEWSSSKVLSQTLSRLEEHNRAVSLLPLWYDIDTIDDLRDFAVRNSSARRGDRCHTYDYICKKLPWLRGQAVSEGYENV